MHAIFVVLSIVLLAATAGAAVLDFRGSEKVEDLMRRLGHRPKFEHTLGVIKAGGALGLLVGLVSGSRYLTIAAALGFTLYFVLAVRAHRSISDSSRDTMPAVVLLVVSAATVITGLLS